MGEIKQDTHKIKINIYVFINNNNLTKHTTQICPPFCEGKVFQY